VGATNFAPVDCSVGRGLAALRAERGVDQDFLFAFLRHSEIALAAMGTGTTFAAITGKQLLSFPMPVPPLPEQRRIVAAIEEHFSRLDAADASLKSAQVRRGALSKRLVDTAWEMGFPTAPLRSLLAEPLANGRSVTTDPNGFPVLRLTALRNRRIDLSQRKLGAWTAAEASKFLVRRGDFLISRGNGTLSLVGRGGLVVCEADPVAYPDTLIRVRPARELCLPEYLALAWDSGPVRRKLESLARTTAGIYKVNQKMLASVELPLPSLDEQAIFVDAVSRQLETAHLQDQTLARCSARSASLRRSILAAAFSGQLVPQHPSDEPAAALLERIAAEQATAKPTRLKKAVTADG
jgi:type I restriction enzyme S subunit